MVRTINAIFLMRSHSSAVSTARAGRVKYTKSGQIIDLATMN